MGPEAEIAVAGFPEGADFAKFRAKAQAYLRAHQDHIAIRKLRTNKPLTAADLEELERVLVNSGVGRPADIERAKSESPRGPEGLFSEAAIDELFAVLEAVRRTAVAAWQSLTIRAPEQGNRSHWPDDTAPRRWSPENLRPRGRACSVPVRTDLRSQAIRCTRWRSSRARDDPGGVR